MLRKYILFLILITSVFFSINAQQQRLRTEDDGFQWYEITEGKLHGALDINGNLIIPTEFSLLVYHANNGYFRGISDESVAAFEPDGTIVISLERNYNEVYKHRHKNGSVYYTVYRKEGDKNYAGICDNNGKEIISPDRGYENITRQEADGTIWYLVYLNKKTGACDADGNELIPPNYESLTYYNGSFHSLMDNNWTSLNISLPSKDPRDINADTLPE